MNILFGKDEITLSNESQNISEKSIASNISLHSSLSRSEDNFSKRPGYNPHEYRWGDGSARILDFFMANANEIYPSIITTEDRITLAASIRFNKEIFRPIFGITIKTKEGITLYGANSETLECETFILTGRCGSVVEIEISFTCRLAPGDYFISLGVASRQGEEIIPYDRRYDSIHLQIRPNKSLFGLIDLGIEMNAIVVTL
jgi:lipopolysaccharide transport system ATP-binding protein